MIRRSEKPLCLAISGPSGVGKDVVVKGIIEKNPDTSFFVTDTNRGIRDGIETPDIEYHFITTKKFEEGINDGDYLEYVSYRPGEYKGINKNRLAEQANKKTILRIDPTATAIIRQTMIDKMGEVGMQMARNTTTIYIHPGDWSNIEKRYFKRDPNADPVVFRQTLEKDIEVYEQLKNKFDYVVVNPDNHLADTIKFIGLLLRNI